MSKRKLISHYDKIAPQRDEWIKKNSYYYDHLMEYYEFLIPKGLRVLEIGCGTGYILNSVKPSYGVGIDFSSEMINIAKNNHPDYTFMVMDAEELALDEKFDYIIISDLIGELHDIQEFFKKLKAVCTYETKIVINYYSQLWRPVLKFGEKFGLKMPQKLQNWLPLEDIQNLLYLADFETIKTSRRMIFPRKIPYVSYFMNNFLAKMPIFKHLSLTHFVVAKPIGVPENTDEMTCTVCIPCRNEKGNIEAAIQRTPKMGKHTEIIFVDGNSTDGTVDEIKRVIEKYPEIDIKWMMQDGTGKGDAVRKGYAHAKGDVLMILDADLTVPPEDLPKFWNALIEGKGEFINGTRLVYPMDEKAMRFLNLLGNKFFSMAFTWLLEQRFRDTLCGTKVLTKENYEKIAKNRNYFGDFDPFGDFDLLFGAAKQNLKIVEVPIRYKERTYGTTNISRFRHGWMLLKMCVFAFRKLKLV
ncbi:MAG: hypothetical protein QG567_593 [Campylobacterota bacterium]|nr:hypothetical protein [Campylobacterota bacterium]